MSAAFVVEVARTPKRNRPINEAATLMGNDHSRGRSLLSALHATGAVGLEQALAEKRSWTFLKPWVGKAQGLRPTDAMQEIQASAASDDMGVQTVTLKKLFALTGNKCAFPGCELPVFDTEHKVLTGEVCHIKAQSPDGPRYDANQTDAERNAFENLVVMCSIHHKIIDDKSTLDQFTVEALTKIKTNHERRKHNTVVKPDVLYAIVESVRRVEARIEAIQKSIGETTYLRTKYPLGYIVFDIDHSNSVLPYRHELTDDYEISWEGVGIEDDESGFIKIKMVTVRDKLQPESPGYTLGAYGPKKVGTLGAFTYLPKGNWQRAIVIKSEILAIRKSGTVFVVGLEPLRLPPGVSLPQTAK
jgi:hypothetical protein